MPRLDLESVLTITPRVPKETLLWPNGFGRIPGATIDNDNHLRFGMSESAFFGRFDLGLRDEMAERELEGSCKSLDSYAMSKVEEIQSEIGKLSAREKQEIRDWLENILEDQLELREEFKAKIEQSERDMAAGRHARVRGPGSGS
jgi:hypothetical protein